MSRVVEHEISPPLPLTRRRLGHAEVLRYAVVFQDVLRKEAKPAFMDDN